MNDYVIIVLYRRAFGNVTQENQPGTYRVGAALLNEAGIARHGGRSGNQPRTIEWGREQFAIAAVDNDSVRGDLDDPASHIAPAFNAARANLLGVLADSRLALLAGRRWAGRRMVGSVAGVGIRQGGETCTE